MPFRPVQLPPQVPGTLWLDAMPGRFGAWSAFEAQARGHQIAEVVCVTPLAEVAQLSPAFRQQVLQIAACLQSGDAVLLHCAAGIGRTGATAACVLKALGLPAGEALQRIRDAGSNPENAQQSGLVDWF